MNFPFYMLIVDVLLLEVNYFASYISKLIFRGYLPQVKPQILSMGNFTNTSSIA